MSRLARAATAALAVLAQVGLAAAALTPAQAAATDEPPPTDPVAITLESLAPGVVAPGEDVTITATLTNTGDALVAEPRLLVHLDRRSSISRSALDTWRDADPDRRLGATVHTEQLETPLAPGESTTVTLTVPAGAVGLRTTASSWGPRALALQVVDAADPARSRLGFVRTWLLWFPPQEVNATHLSVLVPVVGPPPDPYDPAWVDELEALTRPGGRLADVLAATADHRDVTWVVDPWLADVTAPPRLADGGGLAGEPRAGTAARVWGDTVLRAATDREVVLLPYGDADVAALARAGADDVLAAATGRSREVARATGLSAGRGAELAWPSPLVPDLETVRFAAQAPDVPLVVGPGALEPPRVLTYTPTGRTTVDVAGEEVDVLVPDARLSAALATGRVPTGGTTLPADGADGTPAQVAEPPSPVVAAQDLLAELAVITRERPSDGRHLLVTLPRDWHPDPAVAAAQLAALESVPWVRLEPVTALIGTPDPGVDRGALPESVVAPGEIEPAALARLRATLRDRVALAGIVPEPDALLGDLEAELIAASSVAWRDAPAERAELIDAAVLTAQLLRDAVVAEPSTDINLISTTGELPVRVSNALAQPATVVVELRPGDRRLVADESVTVTVPADGEEVVTIPVHAVQSANVPVTIVLRSVDGMLLDDRQTITVRVRAEWEGIGAAVIGVLLAVVLVVGIVRTIRRGRTARRAAPQVEAGPDSLSPEAEPWGPDDGAPTPAQEDADRATRTVSP